MKKYLKLLLVLICVPFLLACEDEVPGPGIGFISKFSSYYDSASDVKNLKLKYNDEDVYDIIVYFSADELENGKISFYEEVDGSPLYIINQIKLNSLESGEGFSFSGQFNNKIEYSGQVTSPYNDGRCCLELSIEDLPKTSSM